ncbi:MAG: glycosyltransferase family 2 protein [Oscillospiraceae bacterium]|nr:glycosyltransferase family 2 protein [Oscillospiraceae bacterium]
MLSVVIPAYNESGAISQAAQCIGRILRDADIPYELVFVDDGSSDDSWKEIMQTAQEDSTVRGISFSRNFGKEAAIFAGLEAAKGECCAVMDCDLQHPPEKLPEMYALWQQGWEVVNGVKVDRGRESGLHGFAAKTFYSIMSRAIRLDMSRASDFKLMDRRVVDTLLALSEHRTFFRALVAWVGFRTAEVEFSVAERTVGDTHWSTVSLFRYAISNIAAYSSAPMQIVTVLGVVTLLLSLILGVQTIVNWFRGGAADGFTTVIILMLLIGSILMISLGIIGYYISQIFMEVKARPRYLVARSCGQGREGQL